MGSLKSNLFTQYEMCTLRHDPANYSNGIVKRSGNQSLRHAEFGNFDQILAALGGSGWSLKAVLPPDEKTGETSWIFERALPGPY